MAVIDGAVATPADARRPIAGHAGESSAAMSLWRLRDRLPHLVSAALLAGLALAVLLIPVGSGDFGQWLMTSRSYLGERVPDYRVMGDVPVVVPAMLAAVQLVVPDGMAALHIVAALLLVALGSAFDLAARLILRRRWAGTATLVIGLLLTDRFTELFAFGGLLQAAGVAFLIAGIGALARAGRSGASGRGWWWLGVGCLWASALSHVGTGLVAVPVGALAALLAFNPFRADALADLRRLRWPFALALALVGYWILTVSTASGDYVTNPASLGYRGPDRLLELLLSEWQTALVIGAGTVTIIVGVAREVRRRHLAGFAILGAWAAASWGLLGALVLSGAATDYPRYGTPLLAPLVIGAGGGLLWALRLAAVRLPTLGARRSRASAVASALVILILVLAPIAVARHTREAAFYQLRDPQSLVAASSWLDDRLGTGPATILADAREAKWIEGLTGRDTLFSQPVRYAFRPVEWERSAAADALLRSVDTITSGLVTARFTTLARGGGNHAPTDLLLAVNHRGEFVDVLRMPAAATTLRRGTASISAARLRPVSATRSWSAKQASLRTVWRGRGTTLSERVTAWPDGSALSVIQRSDGHRITSQLLPVPGMAITSLRIDARDAVACFTLIGDTAPCVRIHAAQPDARISAGSGGGVVTSTRRSDRLDLLVTALTPGQASVQLGLLHPRRLVREYDVQAALLNGTDPAYAERAARLAAVGFVEAGSFGPYRVLLRKGAAG